MTEKLTTRGACPWCMGMLYRIYVPRGGQFFVDHVVPTFRHFILKIFKKISALAPLRDHKQKKASSLHSFSTLENLLLNLVQ
jgi:hypothetical protein